MSLMTDLATYVEAQSGITNLISTRFYPQIAKGGTSLPYTIYSRAGQQRNPKESGSTGLVTTVVRMVHFAETYAGAQAVADAFRLEMDGLTRATTVGSTKIHQCRLDNESDNIDPVEFAQNSAPHFVAQEYAISHKETVPTY